MAHIETWYQWKEINDGDGLRYLTPWSEPLLYEHPMDLLFPSAEDARAYIEEQELEDEAADWVLVKVTYEGVDDRVP